VVGMFEAVARFPRVAISEGMKTEDIAFNPDHPKAPPALLGGGEPLPLVHFVGLTGTVEEVLNDLAPRVLDSSGY
jgi:hypothetical protein